MRAPHHENLNETYRHASFLILFVALATYTLKSYRSSIPTRDFHACVIGLLGVVVSVLSTRHVTRNLPKLNRTKAFVVAFQGLSALEITFTLLAPHLLLSWDKTMQESKSVNETTVSYVLADLLVPHLFILEVQIMLEMLICLSGSYELLLFPYTAMANAYRFLPIAFWLKQCQEIVPINQNPFQLAWLDFLCLYFLPVMTLFLWVSSSFVFLPFIWYPLIQYPKLTSCS